jgi:fibronectin type 3 domain-containing protein
MSTRGLTGTAVQIFVAALVFGFLAQAGQARTNPPSTPGNLTASATSTSQISLSWTASSSRAGLAEYIVSRCTGSSCGHFRQVSTVGPSTTTYVDTGLRAGTTYQYEVTAVDTNGRSSQASNTASAQTLTSSQQSPATPVITSATTASGTVGSAFSYQTAATNSPSSYGASGLPGGLSVNSNSGLISGTPTTAGNFSVTLSASNSGGTGTAALALSITAAGAAGLTISPSPVAFSGVNVGSNSTHTVTLTNGGTATLNISAATITGSGYTMTLQPISLNSGANATFNVTFAPTAAASSSGSISIASNAPNSPATIALSGTGLQAQIAATPSSASFGTVAIGNTNSQTITLKNAGNITLNFSQISVTGTGFNQTGLSTSTTIAAGGSTTFNATFDPSSATAASGSVMLTTNGTPSPLTIGLSGTGQATTLSLGANPTSLSFGNVPDATSSSLATTLTNNGNSNITISGATTTGAGFTASGISNNTSLTPGQSATLTVTFAPASGGAVSGAMVSIASNATNSPTAISLSGTGSHYVVLNWGASPTGGVSYNVFRGTSSGAESTAPLNPSLVSGTTYTDSNVVAGQDYFYTVEAVDSAGSSVPSSEVSAEIPTP